MTPTFGRVSSTVQHSIRIEDIEGVEPLEAYRDRLYQPVNLSFSIVTPSTYGEGINLTLSGPKFRKDGSHGKGHASRHFYNLADVPEWVWRMLDGLDELTEDERVRIAEARRSG